MRTLRRRGFLGIVGGAASLAAGCRSKAQVEGIAAQRPAPEAPPELLPASSTTPVAEPFAVRELRFDSTAAGPELVVVLVPSVQAAPPVTRYPVLVALHGRGESLRGLAAGAYGWLRDYDLGRAMARLRAPPLTREDLHGFVDEQRLARLNASLVERPFRGLLVVCPWVPDILSDRDRGNLDAALPFGRFVTEQLLPRVVTETPALSDPTATGIDGVSLGGRAALVVGLAHADRFGAVASLQAAIQESEAPGFVRRAQAALAVRADLRLRLLTSDRDYFRGPIVALHAALTSARIAHDHDLVPGPHDYVFNRGPGSIEMLLWHDRVLRGEPPL